jgi:membrane AbrB-like protein
VTTTTLRELGADTAAVMAVTLATLGLSVLAGTVLTRTTSVDPATGAFGMVAGGASGIVAIAQELGADPRLVAVMQYLRVLVVVVTAPVVAGAFPAPAASTSATAAPVPGFPDWLLFAAACTGLGLLLARTVRLPAGSLLGPLLVAATAAAAGLDAAGPLPDAVQAVAFAVIGLEVGLSFTPASLRQARDLVVPSLLAIAGLIVVCAGLGALLSIATGVSAVDGYLATTPGGLYAVLAASVGSGGDTAFVLAVQVVRILLMLLAAPLLAAHLVRRRGGPTLPP